MGTALLTVISSRHVQNLGASSLHRATFLSEIRHIESSDPHAQPGSAVQADPEVGWGPNSPRISENDHGVPNAGLCSTLILATTDSPRPSRNSRINHQEYLSGMLKQSKEALHIVRWASVLACVLCLGWLEIASAATWLDLKAGADAGSIQMDTDSIEQVGRGRFKATWREGLSRLAEYDVYRGLFDCGNESITLVKEARAVMDSSQRLSAYRWIIDYAAGTRMAGGQTSPLSDSSRSGQYRFPTGDTYPGLVMARLCRQDPMLNEERKAAAVGYQTRLGCGTSWLEGASICGQEADVLENLHALPLRLEQAKHACGVEKSQIDMLAENWRLEMIECANEPSCSMNSIRMRVGGLAGDLSRAARHLPCEYVPKSLAEAPEATERLGAMIRFKGCVKQKMPELDDRLSAADKTARAILGACRNDLSENLKENRLFMDKVIPVLTAEVLDWRKRSPK